MRKSISLSFLTIFILILFFSVTLAACRPEPLVPQTARVLIVNPGAESILETSDVTISTFIENFDLINSTGEVKKVHFDHSPLKGNIIYYKDVTPPINQGKNALTEEGTYVIANATSYTWKNVEKGKHTFWVQLVHQDNTPLQPPAAVRIFVTVK